jgi:hypothetical protein
VKTRDDGLISNKPRISLRKLTREGVSGESNRWIRNRQPRLYLRPRTRPRGRASADRRDRGVSNRGGECTDQAGLALEGKRTATGVRGGPSRSIKIGWGGVRVGANGSKRVQRGSEGLQMALTGGPGRVRRACVKRYPVVRAVRSESDGGDQTGEIDSCGRRRSSPRR